MTHSSNLAIRVKVNVDKLRGTDTVTATITFASGTEKPLPIDSQDDLWWAVADHKYNRDQVVFGDRAHDLFRQLP